MTLLFAPSPATAVNGTASATSAAAVMMNLRIASFPCVQAINVIALSPPACPLLVSPDRTRLGLSTVTPAEPSASRARRTGRRA